MRARWMFVLTLAAAVGTVAGCTGASRSVTTRPFDTSVPSTTAAVPGVAPVPATASPPTTAPLPTAPAPSTTAPKPGSATITVTEADGGKSYVLRPGDRLAVNLTGPAIYTWTEPLSSDSQVLLRTAGSSGATVSAVFVAAADGQSTVSATDNPNCYPRCLPPSRLFEVHVSVTG